MAKKRNRCRVKSCNVVIPDCYHFCYLHRKWSLADVQQEQRERLQVAPKKLIKRFFCDPCGTVYHLMGKTCCKLCGAQLEELGS